MSTQHNVVHAFDVVARVALALTFATTSGAATLKVESNGLDSTACGKSGQVSCRSISQAIANALVGDTISVGPGRYGDLNGDGDFNDVGDERGSSECALCITKSVRVISTHGAAMTLIDSGRNVGADLLTNDVMIRASNVTFGAPNAGFTVYSRSHEGEPEVQVLNGINAQGNNIRIEANRAVRMYTGFIAPAPTGSVTFVNNISMGHFDAGFVVTTGTAQALVTLTGNLSASNESGYWFYTPYSGANVASNTRIAATGNVAIGTGDGFLIATNSPVTLSRNSAVGGARGFHALGYGGTGVVAHTFTGNTTIGNLGPGYLIEVGARASITGGNIVGNDGADNCGVLNSSGNPVVATNNYWGGSGAPGSPRANKGGPGSGCDLSGVTTVKPNAVTRFAITRADAAGIAPPAGSLRVENGGADSPTCGVSPACRTIHQAIVNAKAGATIAVGPGKYGDLNGDGVYGQPGEEPGVLDVNGRRCLLCIDKAVRIISTHGATVTLIDSSNPHWLPGEEFETINVVGIYVPNVTFGLKGNGFTLEGIRADGVGVLATGGGVIQGNTAVGLFDGFISYSGTYKFQDNSAMANRFSGFRLRGHAAVERNTALVNLQDGFRLSLDQSQATAKSNIASGNMASGFLASPAASGRFTANVAIANLDSGVEGQGFYSGNHFIGNQGPGLTVFLLSPTAMVSTISGSNIFGNDDGPARVFESSGKNCGVWNRVNAPVNATNNFWGRPGGPGPARADTAGAGSGCDAFPASPTTVQPFAALPFAIPH